MSEQSGKDQVSATRVIEADAKALFDVVADPSLHHVIDGSGSVQGVRGGARALQLGDRFSTKMRIGVPYLISNKVVEYEADRRIAWSHIGGWRWRYEFEPVDGGTKVTETFDWSTAKPGAGVYASKWASKNQASMESTLARLEAFVTNTSTSL